ncbi:hypothetical protein [Streptomyces mirabilis]|uniref:hypothetical protein n=1 Tax=Streptomyces mirabilis TaxID=68239 RepID=UPI0036C7E12E
MPKPVLGTASSPIPMARPRTADQQHGVPDAEPGAGQQRADEQQGDERWYPVEEQIRDGDQQTGDERREQHPAFPPLRPIPLFLMSLVFLAFSSISLHLLPRAHHPTISEQRPPHPHQQGVDRISSKGARNCRGADALLSEFPDSLRSRS